MSIIIVEDGKVVADGPKDKILAALSGETPAKPVATPQPAANSNTTQRTQNAGGASERAVASADRTRPVTVVARRATQAASSNSAESPAAATQASSRESVQ